MSTKEMNLSEENQQLVIEQIARLEKELILETRADERFRLEYKIKALKENPTDFISSLSPKNHKNQYIIMGIGGFLLVIVFVGIFLFPHSKVETTITNTTNAGTVNNIGTQVNHIHQYDLEIVKKLGVTEEKLKITEVAFHKFLDIAGEKKVPIEQLPTIMEQMAERYKSALQGVKNLENSDDPEVKQLIQQAEQLLREKVDLDQAEKLLNQAHAKKKDKKSRLKEMLHKEEVEQAAISFQTGQVKLTQLKYKAAGEYYRRAVEELPKDEEKLLALYLNDAVFAMEKSGEYAQATPLAEQALQIREKILGAEHPDVATSLNNLAELYKRQGKNEEALPLYLRALEIDQKVYGKDHPEIATDLNNLALLYFIV